jgi:hypothetical protein
MSIGKLRLKSLDGEEQSDRDESQWIGFADARSNRNATEERREEQRIRLHGPIVHDVYRRKMLAFLDLRRSLTKSG